MIRIIIPIDEFIFMPVLASGDAEVSILNAVISGDITAVKTRLEKDKEAIKCQNISGDTCLALASKYGHQDLIKLLLENHADVNSTNKKLITPLMYATSHAKTASMNLLIQAKAKVDHQDYKGNTALILAALNGHEEGVALLLKSNANTVITNENKRAAMDFASSYSKNPKVIAMLNEKIEKPIISCTFKSS